MDRQALKRRLNLLEGELAVVDKVVGETAGVRGTSTSCIFAQVVVFVVAVLALEAGHRGLVGDEVTWLDVTHLGTDLNHLRRSLMTEHNRMGNDDVAQTHFLSTKMKKFFIS